MYINDFTKTIFYLLCHKITNSNQPRSFTVPNYQREYSWTRVECETLLQDMNESDPGYYIGTILLVCSDQGRFDVIDGQQRLTSISLLLLALYSEIKDKYGMASIQKEIRNMLVCSDIDEKLKLQKQNSNEDDWVYLLQQAGLIKRRIKLKYPPYLGNRRISRNYSFFKEYISGLSNEDIKSLFGKIRNLRIIPMYVNDVGKAYQLFEAINDRGMPLRAIDIIKGKYLIDKRTNGQGGDPDKWNKFIENIGGNYAEQEQYLRNHYNAFKSDYKDNNDLANLPARATRSLLISIYDKLIENDRGKYIDNGLFERAPLYGEIIGVKECADKELNKLFAQFRYAQATSAFLLVLYLYCNQAVLELSDADFAETLQFLLKYFVRRNVTGYPNTGSIPSTLQEIIKSIEQIQIKNQIDTSNLIKTTIFDTLRKKASTNKILETKLSGDIYDDNAAMARYLLYMLSKEDEQKSNEMQIDFWAKTGEEQEEKRRYKWTIEHIMPQNKNLCDEWVTMLAKGDKEQASQIQEEWVHKLGNLTLTGYNSSLSDQPFDKKRDATSTDGILIGFKNGIKLNKDSRYLELCKQDEWTKDKIKSRTENMVNDLLNLLDIGLSE